MLFCSADLMLYRLIFRFGRFTSRIAPIISAFSAAIVMPPSILANAASLRYLAQFWSCAVMLPLSCWSLLMLRHLLLSMGFIIFGCAFVFRYFVKINVLLLALNAIHIAAFKPSQFYFSHFLLTIRFINMFKMLLPLFPNMPYFISMKAYWPFFHSSLLNRLYISSSRIFNMPFIKTCQPPGGFIRHCQYYFLIRIYHTHLS